VGSLLKDRVGEVEEFVDAVQRVAAGGTVIDPAVVRQLLGRRRDPIDRRTPREREVLALMAEGWSNAAIARTLVVTEAAVAKHIGSILTKLDLPPAEDDHRRVRAVPPTSAPRRRRGRWDARLRCMAERRQPTTSAARRRGPSKRTLRWGPGRSGRPARSPGGGRAWLARQPRAVVADRRGRRHRLLLRRSPRPGWEFADPDFTLERGRGPASSPPACP
jgi:Bacterial regulatory proteins, luxR family